MRTGAELRDEGIARAIGATMPGWREEALAFVRDFCNTRTTFTCEDVKTHAEGVGFPAPPDGRAWGGIMVRAKNAGLIVRAGYSTAKTPGSHMGTVAVWRRLLLM